MHGPTHNGNGAPIIANGGGTGCTRRNLLVGGIRADLREWLRRASEDESGYVPWHFEMSFGLEHREERRTGAQAKGTH